VVREGGVYLRPFACIVFGIADETDEPIVLRNSMTEVGTFMAAVT
jgi:hypothetical protein